MDEYTLQYDLQPEESGCLQNRVLYTEDMLTEAMRTYLSSGFTLVSQILLWVFCLVLAGFTVWLHANGMRSKTLFWEVCLLVLMAAAITLQRYVLLPRHSARMQMRRRQEVFGTAPLEPLTIFTDAEIVGKNGVVGDDVMHLQYSSLKRVRMSKGLILLITPARQFVILDRARFENGTEADLWKLLAEKCPKLKLPKH